MIGYGEGVGHGVWDINKDVGVWDVSKEEGYLDISKEWNGMTKELSISGFTGV